MNQKIFHLEYKTTGEHLYYGSIAKLYNANPIKKTMISRLKLYRWNDKNNLENPICIIRKGIIEKQTRKRNIKIKNNQYLK